MGEMRLGSQSTTVCSPWGAHCFFTTGVPQFWGLFRAESHRRWKEFELASVNSDTCNDPKSGFMRKVGALTYLFGSMMRHQLTQTHATIRNRASCAKLVSMMRHR